MYMEAEERGRRHFSEDLGEWYYTAGTSNPYDRIDVRMTARTDPSRTYACEVKSYDDPQHPRKYAKYSHANKDAGYMIDYDKLDALTKVAEEEGRIPVLYCRFQDWTIVWNLADIPWRNRRRTKRVNKVGVQYGKEKEEAEVTYLYMGECAWRKKTERAAITI